MAEVTIRLTNGDDVFDTTNLERNRDTFKVIGLAGNDEIFGDPSFVLDTFIGGTGEDRLLYGAYMEGGLGNDYIYVNGGIGVGGDGDDRIDVDDSANGTARGGNGNDVLGGRGLLFGDAGDDILGVSRGTAHGGDGNDFFGFNGGSGGTGYGGDGDDTFDVNSDGGRFMDGGNGNDTFQVFFNDTAQGGNGNDYIQDGSYGGCVAYGGYGDDIISLSATDGQATTGNSAFGGAGNDTITFGFDGFIGHETIDGEDGDDILISSMGLDEVRGGKGNDRISSGSNSDTISGGAGNDIIDAGSDVDTVAGDGGNDLITAGTGNDQVSGGAGIDTFIFRDGDGADRIADFRADTDFVDLTAVDGIDSFADLNFSQAGTTTTLDLADGDSIVFTNVTLKTILANQDHFLV